MNFAFVLCFEGQPLLASALLQSWFISQTFVLGKPFPPPLDNSRDHDIN